MLKIYTKQISDFRNTTLKSSIIIYVLIIQNQFIYMLFFILSSKNLHQYYQ